MKSINTYIIEKFKISKKTISSNKNREGWQNDEVTNDFCDIKDILKEIEGRYSDTYVLLLGLSKWKDEDENIIESELYFEFDEKLFYDFFREIVNRDYICINESGEVDVENSNHKDIASILKKYISKNTGKKIRESFSW